MRLRVRRVRVLVGLPGARDLLGEPVADGVVGAGVLGVDRRRADLDPGAVGAQDVDLVARRPCPGRRRRRRSPGVARRWPARRRCCPTSARRWSPPGCSAPEASAASIIASAIRSFTEPPGFMYSTLAITCAGRPAVDRAEPHQRGVADELDDAVVDLHGRPYRAPRALSTGRRGQRRPRIGSASSRVAGGGPVAAVQVADGVWRIPTAPADFINSWLLAGPTAPWSWSTPARGAPRRPSSRRWPGSAAQPGDVTHLLLTHAHNDHAGGAEGRRRRHRQPGGGARARGRLPARGPDAGRSTRRPSAAGCWPACPAGPPASPGSTSTSTFTDGDVLPRRRRRPGRPHPRPHPRPLLVPAPVQRRAHHRRRDLQRPRTALLVPQQLHRRHAVAHLGAPARRARLRRRRLHPRTRTCRTARATAVRAFLAGRPS